MRPVRSSTSVRDPRGARPAGRLAANLHWAWDRQAIACSTGSRPGWTAGDAHPVDMVAHDRRRSAWRRSPTTGHRRDVAAATAGCDAALTGPTWFQSRDRLAARHRRLLLAGVRHHRGAPAVLRRPRRARRRPPQGVVRPGVPLVGVGLLYAEGYFHQPSTPTAGSRSARLASTPALGAHRHRRRVDRRPRRRRGRIRVVAGRRRPHRRSTCSTRTSRATRPTASPSPTGCTAATAAPAAPGDRARHRRRAGAARARHRPQVFHTTRATPASSASSGSASWSPTG